MPEVPFVEIKRVIDNTTQLHDRLHKLRDQSVYVGVPASTNARNDGGLINNATLLYIHNFGSPAQNIPARPVLTQGIAKVSKQIAEMFKQAAHDAVFEGKDPTTAYGRIGMLARNAVVEEFDSPSPAFVPLRPATIRARLRKTQAGRRQLRNLKRRGQSLTDWAEAGNIKPLIDTAQLRRAITYVVRWGN